MLGFTAGVMLAAAFFSLILPGLETAVTLYTGRLIPALIITGGMLLSGLFVRFSTRLCRTSICARPRRATDCRNRPSLAVIFTITIHDLPEGLAVGVAFGGDDFAAGTMLATGVGLQNPPEGLAVALTLRSVGRNPTNAFLIAGLLAC